MIVHNYKLTVRCESRLFFYHRVSTKPFFPSIYILVLTQCSKPTNRNWDFSQIDEFLTKSFSENENVAKTLRRIFLFLYLQFAFYWATIAAGMFVNYYYAVPSTVQANFSSIFLQIFAAPSLFAHVTFAVLSTSMSIPLIVLARRVGLRQVVLLHSGAISSRLVGFVAGPLFIYYSTSSISNAFSASISTFTMASVFLIAVILTFLSRIFIVREDVRIKFATPMQTTLVER